MSISRRSFIARSGVLGCSLAASPLLTPVTLAAAPWEARLVVILLRGGMDGLDLLRPYGDPDFASLRPGLAADLDLGTQDLDGYFALHPELAPLMPLWQAQELAFVQAVSTPYRDRRSHFDGQDLLEAGTHDLNQRRDGWLNRLLQHQKGVEMHTAFALGQGELQILNGAAPVSDWSPDAELLLSPQAERLAELLMRNDPLFDSALKQALNLSAHSGASMLGGSAVSSGEMQAEALAATSAGSMNLPRAGRGKAHVKLAEFAAKQLRAETRIAAFSLNGWDTHRRQKAAFGSAARRLGESILALKQGLGPVAWGKTTVVAMTEFGRTVRENGTAGTDHGTGGAMMLAGGAIRGGQVFGRWPGLAESALYDRRDLMPTGDLRTAVAWILQGMTATGKSQLERSVFPGITMEHDPGYLR